MVSVIIIVYNIIFYYLIETPAMPQLSTIPATNRVSINDMLAPSSDIQSLYDAFNTARMSQDSAQMKKVLGDQASGSGTNNILLSAQSHRLADFFKKMLEDFLSNMVETETPLLEAKVKLLELENEQLKDDLNKTRTKAGEFFDAYFKFSLI